MENAKTRAALLAPALLLKKPETKAKAGIWKK